MEQREQRVKPKPCPNCKEDLIQNFCDLCGWNTKTDIIYKKEIEPRSRYIPERVRHEVWRRDMGRCVQCDSQERLEFDHIIPFSKFPIDRIHDTAELDSIDEAADKLGWEGDDQIYNNGIVYNISTEMEFWGHCSNLQAWYEHNYDTRLLRSNISFRLLKKLTEVGDPQTKKVFKEEIAKRLESSYPPVVEYLVREGYTRYLNSKELLFLVLYDPSLDSMYFHNKHNFFLLFFKIPIKC